MVESLRACSIFSSFIKILSQGIIFLTAYHFRHSSETNIFLTFAKHNLYYFFSILALMGTKIVENWEKWGWRLLVNEHARASVRGTEMRDALTFSRCLGMRLHLLLTVCSHK